jgi:hypothetical protein
VDQHDVDVALGHPFEQSLQSRPVSRLGTLASIDKLADYLGIHCSGLAAASFPLGRDGVALTITVLFSLLLGADPEID